MAFLIALLFLSAPPCADEDGHTQRVCVWSDGTGVPVLNLAYGQHWITLDGE